MGADGGISWIGLKNPKKYDRAQELIKPFWFLTHIDDYHYSNVEWSSDFICAPNYIVGTYGTDQNYCLDEEFDEIYPNMDPTPTYGQLTFLELVEDLKTRPFINQTSNKCYYLPNESFPYGMYNVVDSNGRHITKLEEMLWYTIKYTEEKDLREDLGILADMKVNDWLEELRTLLNPNDSGSEETWT